MAEIFNQGAAPTVCLFSKATRDPGVTLPALAAALQQYVTQHLAPVWGCPAKVVAGAAPAPGQWGLGLLDDSDQADALAYHDLTADGFPASSVFVATILDDNSDVPSAASHELAEMLVDPALNLVFQAPQLHALLAQYPPDAAFIAGEVADPVQEDCFLVNGLKMSSFVHPAWFEDFHRPGSVKFDHLGRLRQPFQVGAGGYVSAFTLNKGWSEAFADEAARRKFQRKSFYSRPHRRARRGTAAWFRPAAAPSP